MAYDESLAQRIRRAMARREGLDEKKMFGGIGFLLHGNMCVGVMKEFLIVRLDPERSEEALREPHVEPFAMSGRAMKGWVMVAPAGVREDGELDGWLRRAVTFVETLPAK